MTYRNSEIFKGNETEFSYRKCKKRQYFDGEPDDMYLNIKDSSTY